MESHTTEYVRRVKRRAILHHQLKYDNRHNHLVAFNLHEELEKATASCKRAQRSVRKRKSDRDGDGSPPSRSGPQELGGQ